MQDEDGWLEDLADKVASRLDTLNRDFKFDFVRDHLEKFPLDTNGIAWDLVKCALKSARAGFFTRAMSEVITKDVAQQGEAVYFRVSRILSKRSAAKRRRRKTDWISKRKPPQVQQPQPQPQLTPLEAMLRDADKECATRNRLAWETGRRRGKRRGRVF